jgi:hypothetical protein
LLPGSRVVYVRTARAEKAVTNRIQCRRRSVTETENTVRPTTPMRQVRGSLPGRRTIVASAVPIAASFVCGFQAGQPTATAATTLVIRLCRRLQSAPPASL